MDLYKDWDLSFRALGVMRQGHFKLHSGLHSDGYIDKDALYAHSKVLWELADAISRDLVTPDTIDVIVGPESGGSKFAMMLGLFLEPQDGREIPCAYPRKSDKDKWEYIFERGQGETLRGKRVLIVDDVLTTGDTLLRVKAAIEKCGGIPQSFLVIWDRRKDKQAPLSIPFVAFKKVEMSLWEPSECSLCQEGVPLSEEFV